MIVRLANLTIEKFKFFIKQDFLIPIYLDQKMVWIIFFILNEDIHFYEKI